MTPCTLSLRTACPCDQAPPPAYRDAGWKTVSYSLEEGSRRSPWMTARRTLSLPMLRQLNGALDRAIGETSVLVHAGFLDRVVPPTELRTSLKSTATALAGLDARAHRETKDGARRDVLDAVRSAIETDAEALARLLS
jgi:hypothetical protein